MVHVCSPLLIPLIPIVLLVSGFQLKLLLTRTIEAWVNLFDESNKELLPVLKMELIYDDDKMQFYPAYEDLEELVLFVVEQIVSTLQNVPTVQSWLAGGSTMQPTDAHVADHIVTAATAKLKEATKRNFEEPSAHLEWFSKCGRQWSLTCHHGLTCSIILRYLQHWYIWDNLCNPSTSRSDQWLWI